MPIWVLALIVPTALLACPASMWVFSKLTRQRMSCSMCLGEPVRGRRQTPADLERQLATIDQEIAQVRGELTKKQTSELAGVAGEARGHDKSWFVE